MVEQLQGALASVANRDTETAKRGAPAKLKDRNDNEPVVNKLLDERGPEEGSKVKNAVSGGWHVVEKRRRKQSSIPPSSYHHHHAIVSPVTQANIPHVPKVRLVPGGRGLLPTPPSLVSTLPTRRNLMY